MKYCYIQIRVVWNNIKKRTWDYNDIVPYVYYIVHVLGAINLKEEHPAQCKNKNSE